MAQDGQTVDLDSLQAQIDLSMSITEQLVSSWISASPKIANGTTPSRPGATEIGTAGPSKLRTHEKLEKELEEYMRRPPRLGVGAPIPESPAATSSREAARLKHKLGVTTGSKRKRDDNDASHSKSTISTNINGVASNSSSGTKVTLVADKSSARSHDSGLSDDDREERKGATDRAAGKKARILKTRLDPFAVGLRSKAPPGSDDGIEGTEPAVAASAAADGSPKRKKRRRRKKKGKDIGRDNNEVEDDR